MREQESGVVDVGDVEDPIRLRRRRSDVDVDDTVGDGFTVDQGVHAAFTFKSLGEGEFNPLRGECGFREGTTTEAELNVVGYRGLAAVD